MSRNPRLSPAEQRQHLRQLARHNAQLVRELEGCRTALKQQQRHIRQLVRALASSAPAPRQVATC